MPAPGRNDGIRHLGVQNESLMIDIAVGRSLWRLGDLCLSQCTSYWLPLPPPCLHWLISLLCNHTPEFHLPASSWSTPLPQILLMSLHSLIDGWRLTSYPPTILPQSARPLSHHPSHSHALYSHPPSSPPPLFTTPFIIHHVSLWIQSKREHGWIHRQTQQFAQGHLSNVNVCMNGRDTGGGAIDWRAE